MTRVQIFGIHARTCSKNHVTSNNSVRAVTMVNLAMNSLTEIDLGAKDLDPGHQTAFQE